MPRGSLAYIMLLDDRPVDPGYGVPAPPDVIWGGRPPPMPAHPIVLPPGQPVYPAHPIAPPPPGVWPPQPPVGVWPPPGYPAHPIVPPPVDPGYGVPVPPPGVWPSPPPHPAHPIVLPEPPTPPEHPPILPPGGGLGEGWQWVWSDRWGFILVWYPPEGGGKPQPPLSGSVGGGGGGSWSGSGSGSSAGPTPQPTIRR
jgi:hypothetical protein